MDAGVQSETRASAFPSVLAIPCVVEEWGRRSHLLGLDGKEHGWMARAVQSFRSN